MAALRDPCWGLGSVEDVSDMMTFATVWQRHRVATCELARCNGGQNKGNSGRAKNVIIDGTTRVTDLCAPPPPPAGRAPRRRTGAAPTRAAAGSSAPSG